MPRAFVRLIPSGSVGPSTVFRRYTNLSPTDKWKFRGINTNVCLLQLLLGSVHSVREDILLRYNKVAVISNAMEELCCVSISIL